jgi:Sulfotransferase domain
MFGKLRLASRPVRRVKSPESVYFYALHRCASSLLSDYVLKNVRGLHLVDYEDRFYNGDPVESVTFEPNGFVYGPIRLSTGPETAIYRRFIEPASDKDFIRDKIAIFLIRDPRDIVVSSYYSFGYTHGFSTVKAIQEQQRQSRDMIRGKSVDIFALEVANSTLKHFQTVERLRQSCERAVILKYEDMIHHWEKFSLGLTKYLDISRKARRRTYRLSRPLENESETGHRRSGRPGAYKDKLSASTVNTLNITFAPIFARFDYEP